MNSIQYPLASLLNLISINKNTSQATEYDKVHKSFQNPIASLLNYISININACNINEYENEMKEFNSKSQCFTTTFVFIKLKVRHRLR